MARARSVILMYHRVVASPHDPFWLVVHPDRFAEQLDALRDLADVVPLTSIREHLEGHRVAITFDDGYADNLEIATPELERMGMPATIFVASTLLSASGEFWWDRLEDLVLDPNPACEQIDVPLRGRSVRIDVRTDAGRERALNAIQWEIRTKPRAEIDAMLGRLEAQLGPRRDPCPEHRWMTAEQVRTLASSPVITVGGHTRTHSMLSMLSPGAQWDEIHGCKVDLEAALDRPVTTFAYPFGGPDAVGRVTPRIARKAGYELACSTEPGFVTRWSNRFRLPRLGVYDWSGAEFRSWLGRLLDGGDPVEAARQGASPVAG